MIKKKKGKMIGFLDDTIHVRVTNLQTALVDYLWYFYFPIKIHIKNDLNMEKFWKQDWNWVKLDIFELIRKNKF